MPLQNQLQIDLSDIPDVKQLDLSDIPDMPKSGQTPSKWHENAAKAMVTGQMTNTNPALLHNHYNNVDKVKPVNDAGFIQRLGQAWNIGVKSQQMAELGYRQLIGDDSEQTQKSLEKIRQSIPREEYPTEFGLLEKALKEALKMAPIPLKGMETGLRRGLELGTGAAAITALAGQVGPQVAMPEELITVPTAFLGMLGVGMTAGSLENIGQAEAGLAYLELMETKDADGNRIDPNIIKSAAASVGIINGLIELAQIKMFLRTFPGAEVFVKKAIRETTLKVLADGTLKKIITSAAGKYVGFIGKETAQELVQEATQIVGQELAKELNNEFRGTDFSPATIDEIRDRLIQTATSSALAFSVMGVPGHVTSAITGKEKAIIEEKKVEPTAVEETTTPEVVIDEQVEVEKPTEPVISPDLEPDIKADPTEELLDSYETQKEIWFQEKDRRLFETKVEAKNLEQELKAAIGYKKYSAKEHQRYQDIAFAMQIYIDSKRNPDHIKKYYDQLTEDQQRIVDLSQDLPANVKTIADKISQSYEAIGMEALEEQIIHNVLDNYAARIWDFEDALSEKYRKFGKTTKHAKQRVFETIIEGWASGYNLKITNAIDNLNILKQEIIKTLEDRRFLKALKQVKDFDGNSLITDKRLEGYEEIEHPNFWEWKFAGEVEIDPDQPLIVGNFVRPSDRRNLGRIVAIDKEAGTADVHFINRTEGTEATVTFPLSELEKRAGMIYGKNFFITDEGILLEKRRMYVPKEAAKNLNKILGVSKLSKVPGVHTITKMNAYFKAWILQSSFFHHLAFMRSYYFGTNKKTWAEMNAISAYKEGLKAVSELHDEVVLGVRNGLTLGIRQDWEESLLKEKTHIGVLMDKIKVAKEVKDKLIQLREWQADFLFNELGTGLKAKAFMIEYRNEMRKHPNQDPDVIARRVATLINDDFGGLHLQRLGRDPTLQHIFRLFALAPDWTESNIRTMTKAIKSGSKEETAMYRKFWLGVVTKGMGLTVMANWLLAGGDTEEMLKRYKRAWETGNLKLLEVNIAPIYKFLGGKTNDDRYFTLLGHFRDPFKFLTHPIRSAHHKGSVFYGIFHEAFAGTDWAGRPFTTLSELMETGKTVKWGLGGAIDYDQFPSYLISQIIGLQPIQLQNLIGWMMGDVEGFDAITRSMGLGVTKGSRKKQKFRR